ncbi:hypothetical protein FOXG_01458 [Fusarium oxysporum f. sp. lycopersici 4287]|uniref:F-box domain-containing protein n=2 Tax=Fusarium oxysporum TaxID=5507 RepID=A0A0J9UBB2_FUSO4|nr:hypothetical protein FOXG_01458 [Fusarium oxysporum f. sp. lycopersici 4287]EXK42999.1 hypothetical protein FOMG_05709 [Fusarium oxysporum f. sp. melonis 26406]KAJ9424749.1 hypothetical protein QL093DRAFT_2222329 [Fusarium oxysporum]KNA96152.1 hypothetical protein FOXG_01458 [Fusarium oxysporum f. sp. lycopersici 4287]
MLPIVDTMRHTESQDTQSQQHAPKLANLSPELLRQIFGYFCLHCRGKQEYLTDNTEQLAGNYCQDCQVLVSLCLASRRFRDISQDILHHVFLWSIQKSLVEKSLPLFIRTIASQQHLASSTKAAIFYCSQVAPPIDFDHAHESFEQVAKVRGLKLSDVWDQRKDTSPYREAFLRGLILGKAKSPDATENIESHASTLPAELLFILLALLLKCSHLALDISAHQIYDQMQALKVLGVSSLPLRSLELRGAFDLKWLSSQLIPISSGLEALTLYKSLPLPEISSLKALHLRGFRLSPDQLAKILPSCTGSLKAFTYEATGVTSLHIDQLYNWQVQASDVVRHLEKHRKSLESLHLDLRIRAFMSRDTKIDPMPHLETFTALQELFLNSDAVYSTQSLEIPDEKSLTSFLPPSITSLTLVEPDFPPPPERLQKGLSGLANLRREQSRFPRLKRVTCDVKKIFDESHTKDLLSQVGIGLGYKEFPRSDWAYNRERLVTSPFISSLSIDDEDLPTAWL